MASKKAKSKIQPRELAEGEQLEPAQVPEGSNVEVGGAVDPSELQPIGGEDIPAPTDQDEAPAREDIPSGESPAAQPSQLSGGELKAHVAVQLGIDVADVLAARFAEDCVFATTAFGQKVRLSGEGIEILMGPGSTEASRQDLAAPFVQPPPAVEEAPPLPVPEEQPDELPPLIEEDIPAEDAPAE